MRTGKSIINIFETCAYYGSDTYFGRECKLPILGMKNKKINQAWCWLKFSHRYNFMNSLEMFTKQELINELTKKRNR